MHEQSVMDKREDLVKQWFAMWLKKVDEGMERIFAEDAVYIESWGPEYQGIDKIKHWFCEWNQRGAVLQWDIQQFFHKEDQTVVEWYFKDQMEDGRAEAFEGITLVRWNQEGKICFLKEFGCNENRYDPYGEGTEPCFREERARWF